MEHPRSNDTFPGSPARGRAGMQTAVGRSVIVSSVAPLTVPYTPRRLTADADRTDATRLLGSLGSAFTVRIQPGQACGFARFSTGDSGVCVNRRAPHSTVDTQNSVCIIRSHRRTRNLRFSGVFTSFSPRHSEKLAPFNPCASNLSPGGVVLLARGPASVDTVGRAISETKFLPVSLSGRRGRVIEHSSSEKALAA